MRRSILRPATVVFIMFNVAMFAWFQLSVPDPSLGTNEISQQRAAHGVVPLLWIFGSIALAFVWFFTLPRRCPSCGQRAVRRGPDSVCRACGYDWVDGGDVQPGPGSRTAQTWIRHP
jgi:hypothetical protein